MVVLLGTVRSESRTENKVGLSTEPCGTPLLTGVGVERVSPTTTEKVLFVRKFWNHVNTFPVILHRPSLYSIPICDDKSKAASRSMNIIKMYFFVLNA